MYNPMLLCDFYKISHRKQYDSDTEKIYSTWTPRATRMDGVNKVVVFGFQYFIKKYLIEYFNDNFFSKNIDDILNEYKRIIKYSLNDNNPETEHIEKLHKLGYLPLKICALKEGTLCPLKVPCLTIENTLPDFYWLTNFFETIFSAEIWKPMTSATIALEYKKILVKWADLTCDNKEHVKYQGHDFSMRGMPCVNSAASSGAGHLLSFVGTDTIPAIQFLEKYYNANVENELIGTSIPATEHSVMCCNGKNEYASIKRLITEVYPKGIVSIVSDTWNLWDVITKTLPQLKNEIMQRDGRVVIRPDSGNPVDIICGTDNIIDNLNNPYKNEIKKGVIELLWDIFGGTINSKGYKVLDSHIGCIYGDAITLERANEICKKLKEKGFASSNIVFGIGSFTYCYNTRDTFGFAMKSTYAIKDGQEVFLFKNPITDDGEKKSQKGLVSVILDDDNLKLIDELNKSEYDNVYNNLLQPIYKNGELLKQYSLNDIRNSLNN